MRSKLLTPFVFLAFTSSVMAGTMPLSSDPSLSLGSSGGLAVESELVEDLDGNPVEVPMEFLSSSLDWDSVFQWWFGTLPSEVLNPPTVEIGEEVWSSNTGDVLPVVEQGVLTMVLVTPDLRRVNVPELTSVQIAIAAIIGIALAAGVTLVSRLSSQEDEDDPGDRPIEL